MFPFLSTRASQRGSPMRDLFTSPDLSSVFTTLNIREDKATNEEACQRWSGIPSRFLPSHRSHQAVTTGVQGLHFKAISQHIYTSSTVSSSRSRCSSCLKQVTDITAPKQLRRDFSQGISLRRLFSHQYLLEGLKKAETEVICFGGRRW